MTGEILPLRRWLYAALTPIGLPVRRTPTGSATTVPYIGYDESSLLHSGTMNGGIILAHFDVTVRIVIRGDDQAQATQMQAVVPQIRTALHRKLNVAVAGGYSITSHEVSPFELDYYVGSGTAAVRYEEMGGVYRVTVDPPTI